MRGLIYPNYARENSIRGNDEDIIKSLLWYNGNGVANQIQNRRRSKWIIKVYYIVCSESWRMLKEILVIEKQCFL